MSTRLSRCLRASTILLLPILLIGCTTAAQRQVQQTGVVAKSAADQAKACTAEVFAKPEYSPLVAHGPDLLSGQYSTAQLTDESLPSAAEAHLYAARHDELTRCRTQLLSALAPVRPDAVPILSSAWAEGTTKVVVPLVERKLTWGEAANLNMVETAELREKLSVADRQWIAEMNASHQAELAQRQAASAALLQWSAQQQLIQSLNRPVVTTCSGFANTVNCMSR